MKKIIVLLLVCVQMTVGHAQAPYKREFALGASFGANFSNMSFIPRVDTKTLLGYSGGLVARWCTEKHLGLQMELNYSQQGWDERFEDPQYVYTRTLNYLEFPLLTHIYFGEKKVRFFFNLGPKVGYVYSESTEENLNGAQPNRVNDQHDLPVEKKFGWGLCGGPGLELRTKAGLFTLEGRYYYALGDIYNSRREDPFAQSSGQVLSVKLAYLLPF